MIIFMAINYFQLFLTINDLAKIKLSLNYNYFIYFFNRFNLFIKNFAPRKNLTSRKNFALRKTFQFLQIFVSPKSLDPYNFWIPLISENLVKLSLNIIFKFIKQTSLN